MRSLRSLIDPCFLFRPDIFLKACVRKCLPRPQRSKIVSAWGDQLVVNPHKFIGAHLYMRGVHELPVSEILYRLTSEGDLALDVGANIGVMSSLLSMQVGSSGRVISIEAHPLIYQALCENVTLWGRNNVDCVNIAASEEAGELTLVETGIFDSNEGTARIGQAGIAQSATSYMVKAERLDDLLGSRVVSVMKIDVEGHEAAVLKGAAESISGGQIRDIVFESTIDCPNPVHQQLIAAGYVIRSIGSTLGGPTLSLPVPSAGEEGLRDYLATLDLPRAEQLLKPRGWKVLKR